MKTLRDVAVNAFTSAETERGELLTNIQSSLDDIFQRYKKKNTAFEKAFQYAGILSNQYPLSFKRDKTIASAYQQVEALDKAFQKLGSLYRVTSTKSLSITQIDKETKQTTLINTKLQEIQETLREESTKLNQQYQRNIAAYNTYLAARKKFNTLYTSLRGKASTNTLPDSLFRDEDLRQHFRALDSEYDNLQEFYDSYENTLTKKLVSGYKKHPSLESLLTDAKTMVDSYYETLAARESAINVAFEALNAPYHALLEQSNEYDRLSQNLLEACSFTESSRPPHNTIRELTTIFEVLQPLKENVVACRTERDSQIRAIPFKTGWVAAQTAAEQQSLRSLKTIERLVLREHDKAQAKITEIDECIAENQRSLRRFADATQQSLTDQLQDIQGRLALIRKLGLDIEKTRERQQEITKIDHACAEFFEHELSDRRQTSTALYYHAKDTIAKIREQALDLSQRIEMENSQLDTLVVTEKQRFNSEVTELLAVLTTLQQLKKEMPPYSLDTTCFLEPGHYDFNGKRGTVTKGNHQFTFTLNPALDDEINRLKFESCDHSHFTPTLVCLRETLNQKKAEIKRLQLYNHVIDQSMKKRQASLEVSAINMLFDKIGELREDIRTTNRMGFNEEQIAGANMVLDNIVDKIEHIKTRYLNLQIEHSKAFIDEAKQTIFDTIIYGTLEPLSDGARAPFIQLFRLYVLRPVLDFLHKHTPFLQNCSMTFYASEHEKAMVRSGRDTLTSLDSAVAVY